ncbi:hypothetical protein PVK06_030486 [Gossypium arboreum]|uniref:Uncharacterized protein n=1 Tax=Gossypium arboreum TaxID=29729 RepID=A0ABR0NNP2_GOSAR|nr:hypothetical protein PVK06_030486 [Gossypium arboreum]
MKSCGGDNEEIAATSLEKERTVEASESFGPWMFIGRKSLCNPRTNSNIAPKNRPIRGRLKIGTLSKAKEGGPSNLMKNSAIVDPMTLFNCMNLNVKNGNSISPGPIELNTPILMVNSKEKVESTILSSHFNSTFEGLTEPVLKINPNILDPGRHWAVSLKENTIPNSPKDLENAMSGATRGHRISKGWGSGGKGVAVRNDKPFSIIIQDRQGHFKNFGNPRYPLSESMNSMVELIPSQVENKTEKETLHKVDNRQEKPTCSQ